MLFDTLPTSFQAVNFVCVRKVVVCLHAVLWFFRKFFKSFFSSSSLRRSLLVQASSEHSVCFAVSGKEGERARGVLRAKFADAIRAGRIQDVDVEKNCAVLAAVGQRMAANRGVAAKFFDALATAGVNIKAMAQGSSEYNITVMVEQVRRHSQLFALSFALGTGAACHVAGRHCRD